VLVFVFCGAVFAGQINITPKPGLIKPGKGFFILTEDTRILHEKVLFNATDTIRVELGKGWLLILSE